MVRYSSEAYDRHEYANDRYVLCTSRDDQGTYHGRLTSYLKNRTFAAETQFYLCGNSDMIFDAIEILKKKKDSTAIRFIVRCIFEDKCLNQYKNPKSQSGICLVGVFDIVGCNIGVFNSGNLFVRFIFAANFKNKFAINNKIACFNPVYGMTHPNLIEEKVSRDKCRYLPLNLLVYKSDWGCSDTLFPAYSFC